MVEKPKKSEGSAIAVYDQVGNLYAAEQNRFRENQSMILAEIWKELLPELEDKLVADIGCGQGNELISYAIAGAHRVYGIEPSTVMRQLAEENVHNNPTITILNGTFEKIPLPDESVDIVTAQYALHILTDLKPAFSEISRILKTGGLFIASVSHPDFDAYIAQRQHKEIGDRVDMKLFDGRVTLNNGTHTMDEYTHIEGFMILESNSTSFGKVPDGVKTDLFIKYQKI